MERLGKFIFFVGLIVFFVFGVASRIPAQMVLAPVAAAAGPSLGIGGVSGTLWKGRARTAHINVSGKVFDLGGLRWKVNPWSLLAFQACAEIHSDLVQGNVCRSLSGGNQVSSLLVDRLPANSINGLVGADLRGMFGLTIQKASFSDKLMFKELDGNVTWDGAWGNAQGGGWYELGSFAAKLSNKEDGGVRAEILDTAGEFEMNLVGEYTLGGEPTINGTVKPRENAPDDLVVSMGLFAQQQDDGTYLLTWPL